MPEQGISGVVTGSNMKPVESSQSSTKESTQAMSSSGSSLSSSSSPSSGTLVKTNQGADLYLFRLHPVRKSSSGSSSRGESYDLGAPVAGGLFRLVSADGKSTPVSLPEGKVFRAQLR